MSNAKEQTAAFFKFNLFSTTTQSCYRSYAKRYYIFLTFHLHCSLSFCIFSVAVCARYLSVNEVRGQM